MYPVYNDPHHILSNSPAHSWYGWHGFPPKVFCDTHGSFGCGCHNYNHWHLSHPDNHHHHHHHHTPPHHVVAMFERALYHGEVVINADYTMAELVNKFSNWKIKHHIPDVEVPMAELESVVNTYLRFEGERMVMGSIRSPHSIRWTVQEQCYIKLAGYVSEWEIYQAAGLKDSNGNDLQAGGDTYTIKVGKRFSSSGGSSDVTSTYKYAETLHAVRFYVKS